MPRKGSLIFNHKVGSPIFIHPRHSHPRDIEAFGGWFGQVGANHEKKPPVLPVMADPKEPVSSLLRQTQPSEKATIRDVKGPDAIGWPPLGQDPFIVYHTGRHYVSPFPISAE